MTRAPSEPRVEGPTADLELALEHGMTEDEYGKVCLVLGRDPTVTELGMYSVMWSEHCSYKSSRSHLRTLPTGGASVLQGPGENAGVVDLGDGWAGVFKVESHNHPSYIEPFQGAATGVGGILRDIFTMGARPLALLNSLRFGLLEQPKNRFLLDSVVAGIAGYGNCIGVPTVGGEIVFDSSYDHNPLVNVMCFGVAPIGQLVLARSDRVGDPVIYVGAKTGRDGIYGVSLLASATFEAGMEEKRPAVQVGDPFTEKLLMESCLELVERGLVVGMQDLGGAGLTCATSEISAKSDRGMEIDVGLVPTRETGMTPYEIMLSESQERMLLVCQRRDMEAVQEVFGKWDLHAVEIGRVTEDGMVRVFDGDRVIAEIPAVSLADDAPLYERPQQQPEMPPELRIETASTPVELESTLLGLLSESTIASKRWVFQQYDHTVRTNTIQRPGGDAAVIRLKGTRSAVALSIDGNPHYSALDPRQGAALAVAEACRNVACTGARPLAITNCLNFGNPEVGRTMGAFGAAVAGISDACRALQVPVTGGNVSFYNETDRQPILPTPVIGAMGKIENAEQSVPSGFRVPEDLIVLVGSRIDAELGDPDGALDWGLGGSVYARLKDGLGYGCPPVLDLEREVAVQRFLVEAAAKNLLRSAHDCSDGGLAVALAEACFASADTDRVDAEQATAGERAPAGLFGGTVELNVSTFLAERLFGEVPSRVVVSVAPSALTDLMSLCAEYHVPAGSLGVVTAAGSTDGDDQAPRLKVLADERCLLDVSVNELYATWAGSLAAQMERVG